MGAAYLIVGGLTAILFYLGIWARSHYTYWRRKGIIHPRPIYLLGNSRPFFEAPSELYTRLYRKYSKHKFVGFYEIAKIRLLLIDPELIHKVLIRDFSHFHDRAIIDARDLTKADMGLFLMKGTLWRAVRNKLSPTFTSGKLSGMLDSMSHCYENLEKDYLDDIAKSKNIDAREMMFSYTSDIIASTAFGIDVHKQEETRIKFRSMGMLAFQMDLAKLLGLMVMSNFPKLSKYLNISFISPKSSKYFGEVLRSALKYRRQSGYARNDFLQLLMQIKEKGSVEHRYTEPEDLYLGSFDSSNSYSFEFDEDLLMAQAFTFITAGMEPSANTLTFAVAEFARNQEIQDKAREEIRQVLEIHESFTYQAVKAMEYLELCLLETLRLYPVAKQLMRVCTKEYETDGIRMEAGTNIVIPVRILHRDPRYFSEPLVFDPERFQEPSHPLGSFLPFGDGPRICIGMRFAMLEMKLVLAKLLNSYRILPADDFTYPIPLNRWSFFSVPSGPVHVKIQPILDSPSR